MGCAALAAQPAPPLSVTVIVVNANSQPPQPVKAAHVSLTHLVSAQLAVDAQGPTNPRGEAQLLISQSAAKNGDLRIVISGAGNLVIYEPADGQLPSLKSPIKIVLLPKGSLALLGPAQIQAYLHRLLLQVNGLQKQVSTFKTEAAQGQGQQQYLAAAMAEFAQTIGFPHDQVDQQVAIWAQNIKMQAARATTADQRGLADFALKDYAAAARDFNEAGDATQEQMNAHEATAAAYKKAQQSEVDAARDDLRQLINQRQSAAGADQLNLKFHDATQTLESAVSTAEAEYGKHKDDIGFHELWLEAASSAANARLSEGEVAPASQSLPLLAQSAADFDSLAREYAALGARQAAAAAQDGMGTALVREGERANGDKATELLDQAVHALRDALEVRTKADLPQDWATTQTNLGNALMLEGERVSGDKAMALLSQAAEDYRSVLEVRTKADQPREWAWTQTNLGVALEDEGKRASGYKALELLHQAVQAYGNALQVFTQADQPQDWAQTQNNLGNALDEEGERASGVMAVASLDLAVQAFRNALKVYTKADLPQDWALAQNNLGNALSGEGERALGDKAAALLDQAVQAYRSALEVFTKADLPQEWAMTQYNLGIALEN
jgi:tetratricopeptide (TPR) repeat protein